MKADESVAILRETLPVLSDQTIDTFRRGAEALLNASDHIKPNESRTAKALGKRTIAELERTRPDECRAMTDARDFSYSTCPCFLSLAQARFDGREGFRGTMSTYLSAVLRGEGSATSAVLYTLDWQTEIFEWYWKRPLQAIWASGREVIVVQYQLRGRSFLIQFPLKADFADISDMNPNWHIKAESVGAR